MHSTSETVVTLRMTIKEREAVLETINRGLKDGWLEEHSERALVELKEALEGKNAGGSITSPNITVNYPVYPSTTTKGVGTE